MMVLLQKSHQDHRVHLLNMVKWSSLHTMQMVDAEAKILTRTWCRCIVRCCEEGCGVNRSSTSLEASKDLSTQYPVKRMVNFMSVQFISPRLETHCRGKVFG
ncbi:hypothetical protein M758_2G194400 [Ceratodon purpureus]|uniref:Uncharacterized protein n=1 Tax=Ceratodon purpureus TaxID=3225 RepID=A0A8T0IZU8_CERPU|nr:hypothetical protein KC19_2G240900 [Ceratodon purpureus]KAG0627356.1 hypothetical protein M758_2G194400 [Ceratodon purpureus]